MSNVAKLKKQAAELELKKQFDKALAIYVKLLDSFDQNADELDVALFNRVGDLMLRQGSVADAVDYYEKAVDRYADTGFFNNAIALCNKILRHSPGRATVYYKLGKISAQKGFKNDAKVNFLEYADRMHKSGKPDEAFRALKEFADLCPDQDDIRLMLADQLTKANKKEEAIEQLQTLYERYESEGRSSEAAATADRIRAIDPTIELRATAERNYKSSSADLIFLNLDDDDTPPRRPGTPAPSTPIRDSRPTVIAEPILNEVILDEPVVESSLGDSTMLELTRIDDDSVPVDRASGGSLLGLESTQMIDDSEAGLPSASLLEFEPAALDGADTAALPGLEPTSLTPEVSLDAVLLEADVIDLPPVEPTPPRASGATDARTSGRSPRVSGGFTPPRTSRTSTPVTSLPDLAETPSSGLDFILPDAEPDDAITPLSSPALPDLVDLSTESRVSEPSIPAVSEPLPDFDAVAEPVAEATEHLEPTTEATLDAGIEALDAMDALGTVDDGAATEFERQPGVLRPTPRTSRVALEGLPVMDFDAPPESAEAVEQAADDLLTPTPAMAAVPDATELEPPSVVMDAISDAVAEPTAPELEGVPDVAVDAEPTDAEDLAEAEAEAEAAEAEAAEARAEAEAPVDENVDEEIESDDDDVAATRERPVPSMAGRRSTVIAAQSAEILRAVVEADPEDWNLRRQLAERLLDAGERAEGIKELEIAMSGAEKGGDLDLASSLAEEIARLEPDVVRHHQKRVEFAFRTSDRPRLIDAYLGLADALLRADQPDKSRAVYQRVIDLAPDDARARAALDTIVVPPPPPPTPATGRASTQRRTSAVQPTPAKPPAEPQTNDGFVNLGDWLRDEEAPKDTRMVVAEQEPTGDEDADFADMLRKFKQGVAENVDAEDYQSHYDLAIAFKEMGLIDEAIAEFQKALGSPHNRVPTFESLGQCFLEKKQYKLASSILGRALAENVPDDKLVGVLYLLGISAEAQGNMNDALSYYQRVFIVDIQFRDIAERLSGAERAAR